MNQPDTIVRVNNTLVGRGLPARPVEVIESKLDDVRRSLADELGLAFGKEITVAITSGVGYIYRLSPATNTDVLWKEYGRAVHSDGTEISILPLGTTSRDLTYPRTILDYYWGCIESTNSGADVTLTVWLADGSGAAPDGNVLIDTVVIPSLANWPVVHEAILVERLVSMLSPQVAAVKA
jgi:hypothetical protein